MDHSNSEQETSLKFDLNESNKTISSTSVVSCLDDNLNYTYAKSCKGGSYYLILILIKCFNR